MMRVVGCTSAAAMRFCVNDTLYECGTHFQKYSRSEQRIENQRKTLNLQNPAYQYGHKKEKTETPLSSRSAGEEQTVDRWRSAINILH